MTDERKPEHPKECTCPLHAVSKPTRKRRDYDARKRKTRPRGRSR